MAKKLDNLSVANAIIEESPSLKSTVGVVKSQQDLETLYERLATMPTNKNEFFEALTNKIVKTVISNQRTFKNPLGHFYKGKLLFGEGIENVFIDFLKSKSYDEQVHFENHSTSVEDLMKGLPPKLRVDYLVKNIDREYKTSISDRELKKAFFTEDGLTNLTQKIVSNLLNTAQRDMYKDMKEILIHKTDDEMNNEGVAYKKGAIKLAEEHTENKSNLFVEVDMSNEKEGIEKLATLLKTYSGNLLFPSDKYNLAKVETFTDSDKLVWVTTPNKQSLIDTNVLSSAFNLPLADVQVKKMLVDDLGTTVGATDSEGEVIGVLCDEDLLQYWIVNEMTSTFVNAERKNMQNIFQFIESVSGINPFAQFVIFKKK